MNDFRELVNECETALRAGRSQEAAKLLQNLVPIKVPRDLRLPLSRLCRRCDLTTLGLKLLTPVIYPEKKGIAEPASDFEWAEFAALRLKIGSVDEALRILSGLNDLKVPDASMLRAFCHMAKWDYKAAASELKSFLKASPQPYPGLIARVNLAASLISFGEMDEALPLLETLIVETEAGSYDRLRANCFELRGQIHLHRQDNEKCRSDLMAASIILSAQKTADQLYVQKWLAVLEARKLNSESPLLKLKKEAVDRHNWETVRELDFQMLQIRFQYSLYQHLYWGTPFESYRKRIREKLGHNFTDGLDQAEADSYRYGHATGPCVDLRQAQVTGGQINPGKQVHRLLGILLQDFYKPISVGALYADIFPGEYYNVFSSPDRVHQVLSRARRWFEKNKIPAAILEIDGRFKLELQGPASFIVGSSVKHLDSNSVFLQRLKKNFAADASFTSAEIGTIISLSKPSAVRFINWAIKSGHFKRRGQGRSTSYSFCKI